LLKMSKCRNNFLRAATPGHIISTYIHYPAKS